MLVDYNKGTSLLNSKKYEKAIQHFKRELQTNEFKECWLNLGNAYRSIGKLDLARHAYQQSADTTMPYANSKTGEYAMALNNLGLMEYTLGRDDAAIAYYKRSLATDPELVDALWNYASAALRKLCSGEPMDSNMAWQLYSYRFKRLNPTALDVSLPFWDGVSHHSKIMVLTEQGYGDKLQFGRYLKPLQQYCDELLVQCPPELVELHSPKYKTYTGTNAIETGATCSIPICNLAQKFGVGTSNYDWFKHKVVPQRLGPGTNIICEWQGSATHSNDRNRSCSVGYFNQLCRYGNLYNIRPDAVAPKWMQCLRSQSWMQSASWVAGCDLVVTVDTSLVHLAGSLGVPTILLQPRIETDFRWGNDSMGLENLWYPSVKVVRNPNNWEHVFKQVHTLLQNG